VYNTAVSSNVEITPVIDELNLYTEGTIEHSEEVHELGKKILSLRTGSEQVAAICARLAN
jgi:hypothetical protein